MTVARLSLVMVFPLPVILFPVMVCGIIGTIKAGLLFPRPC